MSDLENNKVLDAPQRLAAGSCTSRALAQEAGRCGSLGAIVLVISAAAFGDWCTLTPDSFAYLTTARTLIETGRFPATQMMHPPGFAALIAPLMLLGDLPFGALRLLFAACWAVTAVLTYLLYRRDFGSRSAWFAGAMVATSSVLLSQSTVLLSETVFVPISLCLLLLLERWWSGGSRGFLWIIVGGALTAVSIMIRSIALLFIPLAVAALLHGPDPKGRGRLGRLGLLLIIAAGPYVAWQVREATNPEGPGYLRMWTTAREAEHTDATGLGLQLQRLQKFGPQRLESIKEVVLPIDLAWRAFQPPMAAASTLLVGGLFVALTMWRSVWWRRPSDLYVLATLAVLAFWPWSEGVRLVAPLIPLFAGQIVWFAAACWTRARPRADPRLAVAGVATLLVLSHLAELPFTLSRLETEGRKSSDRLRAAEDVARWLEANTLPGAEWQGVTPDGDNSKLLLLGASYAVRRPVTTIDVHPHSTGAIDLSGVGCAFVHEALLGETGRIRGFLPTARIGPFFIQHRLPASTTSPARPARQPLPLTCPSRGARCRREALDGLCPIHVKGSQSAILSGGGTEQDYTLRAPQEPGEIAASWIILAATK